MRGKPIGSDFLSVQVCNLVFLHFDDGFVLAKRSLASTSIATSFADFYVTLL